jgi:hypothetical protein
MLDHLATIFAAVFAIQLSLTVPVHALDDPHLPPERDIYFKHDGLTWSDYLHLRHDGTYRQITRHHLYVEERDRGTWGQNQAGELLLKSDLHYHNIVSGVLSVSVWHRDTLGKLPELKNRIKDSLKDNRSASIAAKAVESIGEVSVVGIDPVKRTDLEGLLSAIDEFMASSTKNVFVLKPLTYQLDVIFIHDDRLSLTRKVIDQELAGPPHPAHKGERHGYQEIEASKFNEEVKDTQPFLFFPEMNKRPKRIDD